MYISLVISKMAVNNSKSKFYCAYESKSGTVRTSTLNYVNSDDQTMSTHANSDDQTMSSYANGNKKSNSKYTDSDKSNSKYADSDSKSNSEYTYSNDQSTSKCASNDDQSTSKCSKNDNLSTSKCVNNDDDAFTSNRAAQVAVARRNQTISRDARLELFAEIHSRPSRNESHESIVGAIFIGDDHILMAVYDDGESRLRLMDMEGTVINDVITSPCLWGLARVDADSAIVLLEGAISYYELDESKKLVFKLRFNIPEIRKDGFSISNSDSDSTFVVGCEKKILKFDLFKKKVIKSIPLYKHSLIAMTVYGDKYIFCDRYSYSVICIDEEGNELFIFRHDNLKFPRSICTDLHGYIYVTGELSNNVFRLKPDGNIDCLMLSKRDGILKPRVVSVSCDLNRTFLLVDNLNRLKVYHLLNM